MYIKRHYTFLMTLRWSKDPLIYGMLYAAIPVLLWIVTEIKLILPWQPISVVGIAVAFYLGFKNNSSYDRTWDARKIWGSIVNTSRTFASQLLAILKDDPSVAKELIYRHIAWLTALRYQLRLSREWEHTEDRINGLYSPDICEDYYARLDDEIVQFIAEEEFLQYKGKSNMATQLIARQTEEVNAIYKTGKVDGFEFKILAGLLERMYDDQGKCERIKNFPFPRQYASTTLWTAYVFAALVPFGMLQIFSDLGNGKVWLTIPFSGLVIWLFFLMEKIGDYSENPFEGTYNDVPITSISRNIEIDLREMLGESELPPPVKDQFGFLM